MKKVFLLVCVWALCAEQMHAQGIGPHVNEQVELMSILAKLAGFPEYSMDLAGQYSKDIDAYFKDHKNHEAVQYIKELRQQYGIAYDAVMSMAIHLQQQEGTLQLVTEEYSTLEKRWQKVDKEKFLTLLNQFYRDTRFREFFTAHQEFYAKGIQSYKENVLTHFDVNWYAAFYGKEPQEHFSVIIGFCNGGGNYGAERHIKDGMKEVFAIVGYYVNEEDKPMYSKDYLPTLVHEFNHSFVNYLLTDSFPQYVESFEKISTEIMQLSLFAMQRQAYGTWQTIINESIVRAAVICYMLDKNYAKEEVQAEIIEQVQRNFRWMPELVQVLRQYEREQNKHHSLENFYPHIISFFEGYVEAENKRLNAIWQDSSAQ